MRKKKFNYLYIFFLLFFLCISIGYAVMSKNLDITGNSQVKSNNWDIHFENVVVKEGSVTATKIPTIDAEKDGVDFSVSLNLPGDFYEFTIDIKNSGTIDGMIDSVTKIPELSDIQKKYLNYIIEYENGEQIVQKQLIPKKSFVRLKVRVEYKSDIDENDLPTSNDNLNLGFTLNYIQGDDTGVDVLNLGMVPNIYFGEYYSGVFDEENIKFKFYEDGSCEIYSNDVLTQSAPKGYLYTTNEGVFIKGEDEPLLMSFFEGNVLVLNYDSNDPAYFFAEIDATVQFGKTYTMTISKVYREDGSYQELINGIVTKQYEPGSLSYSDKLISGSSNYEVRYDGETLYNHIDDVLHYDEGCINKNNNQVLNEYGFYFDECYSYKYGMIFYEDGSAKLFSGGSEYDFAEPGTFIFQNNKILRADGEEYAIVFPNLIITNELFLVLQK